MTVYVLTTKIENEQRPVAVVDNLDIAEQWGKNGDENDWYLFELNDLSITGVAAKKFEPQPSKPQENKLVETAQRLERTNAQLISIIEQLATKYKDKEVLKLVKSFKIAAKPPLTQAEVLKRFKQQGCEVTKEVDEWTDNPRFLFPDGTVVCSGKSDDEHYQIFEGISNLAKGMDSWLNANGVIRCFRRGQLGVDVRKYPTPQQLRQIGRLSGGEEFMYDVSKGGEQWGASGRMGQFQRELDYVYKGIGDVIDEAGEKGDDYWDKQGSKTAVMFEDLKVGDRVWFDANPRAGGTVVALKKNKDDLQRSIATVKWDNPEHGQFDIHIHRLRSGQTSLFASERNHKVNLDNYDAEAIADLRRRHATDCQVVATGRCTCKPCPECGAYFEYSESRDDIKRDLPHSRDCTFVSQKCLFASRKWDISGLFPKEQDRVMQEHAPSCQLRSTGKCSCKPCPYCGADFKMGKQTVLDEPHKQDCLAMAQTSLFAADKTADGGMARSRWYENKPYHALTCPYRKEWVNPCNCLNDELSHKRKGCKDCGGTYGHGDDCPRLKQQGLFASELLNRPERPE